MVWSRRSEPSSTANAEISSLPALTAYSRPRPRAIAPWLPRSDPVPRPPVATGVGAPRRPSLSRWNTSTALADASLETTYTVPDRRCPEERRSSACAWESLLVDGAVVSGSSEHAPMSARSPRARVAEVRTDASEEQVSAWVNAQHSNARRGDLDW